ncbi:MAG: hypothetical protein HN742_16255 [Lentisphaerae bacterium]|jgi:hypothetical protein|nr:hypothetical protein [Lentisphaerota bacterium]MBT4818984.1 hypothetical protein [Lentisphaerota bacterium]MBT5612175.1 hypothetical protein [Lentisphaerota bacterium]MBT7061102.1 hypothetical protein [Lentisphaerota bacterium]MBT7843431.1 hypothetical protein [Lentisphaerota bacterium]
MSTTPRERIKTVLAHRRPDRLPRYEILFPAFCESWRTWRGASDDADLYAHYSKIDIGTILASQGGPFVDLADTRQDGKTKFVRDTWGRLTRHEEGAKLFEVVETPIARKTDLDRLDFGNPKTTPRPDLEHLASVTPQVAERFAPVSGVMGLFMPSHYLRGEITFLMDLLDDEPFCQALIGRVAEFITALGECVLDRTDTWDTALWVYDDFGSNHGPLMSPDVFERCFFPAYKKMIDTWKSKGLTNVILHHDANCWAVLDMLVDAGFTGIQGIYPGAGMSIPDVKAKYGDRLALVGGICNISVLAPGPKRKIANAVAEIAEVARDGGVVIGAHSIEEDVPPEHYDYYSTLLAELDQTW